MNDFIKRNTEEIVNIPLGHLDQRLHKLYANAHRHATEQPSLKYKTHRLGTKSNESFLYYVGTIDEWNELQHQLWNLGKRLPRGYEIERELQKTTKKEAFYPNGKPDQVSWANEAGMVKTKEQMELIEEQAFENGRKEALKDARSGLYAKSEEIYNADQVKQLIREAMRKHEQTTIIALKRIHGVYRLPEAVAELIRDMEINGEEVDHA